MWICTDHGSTAFNLHQVTRLFVEETAAGAALKAEVSGKAHMVAYYTSKTEARAALQMILEQHQSGTSYLKL